MNLNYLKKLNKDIIMKHVYFIQEKDEDTVFDDDDFVVYETFQTAVTISKQLLKDKLAYLKENFDTSYQSDIYLKEEKELFEAEISDDDEVTYRISIKKIPLIH